MFSVTFDEHAVEDSWFLEADRGTQDICYILTNSPHLDPAILFSDTKIRGIGWDPAAAYIILPPMIDYAEFVQLRAFAFSRRRRISVSNFGQTFQVFLLVRERRPVAEQGRFGTRSLNHYCFHTLAYMNEFDEKRLYEPVVADERSMFKRYWNQCSPSQQAAMMKDGIMSAALLEEAYGLDKTQMAHEPIFGPSRRKMRGLRKAVARARGLRLSYDRLAGQSWDDLVAEEGQEWLELKLAALKKEDVARVTRWRGSSIENDRISKDRARKRERIRDLFEDNSFSLGESLAPWSLPPMVPEHGTPP